VLINSQRKFKLLCIHITNKKFANVFVRASVKSHIPAADLRTVVRVFELLALTFQILSV